MKNNIVYLTFLLGLMMIGFGSCEGDQGLTGPAGPVGPAGPQGATGQDGVENCMQCHGNSQLITAKLFHLAR